MTTPLEAIKAGIEALEPFAKAVTGLEEINEGHVHDSFKPRTCTTVADYRRARTAYALLSQVEGAQAPSVEEVARVAEAEKVQSTIAGLRRLADSLWSDDESEEGERRRRNYSLLHDAAYMIGQQDVFLHHWKVYGCPPDAIASTPPKPADRK